MIENAQLRILLVALAGWVNRQQRLIVQMATADPIWGEERIAADLQLKLGVQMAPRTIRRSMPRRTSPDRRAGLHARNWA